VTSDAQIEAYKLVRGVWPLGLYVPSSHEREFSLLSLSVSSHSLKKACQPVRSNKALRPVCDL
jgi:hypothetical protein